MHRGIEVGGSPDLYTHRKLFSIKSAAYDESIIQWRKKIFVSLASLIFISIQVYKLNLIKLETRILKLEMQVQASPRLSKILII